MFLTQESKITAKAPRTPRKAKKEISTTEG